jgi:hypothetical protein
MCEASHNAFHSCTAAVTLVGDFMAHGHPAALVDQLEILETKGAIRLNGD